MVNTPTSTEASPIDPSVTTTGLTATPVQYLPATAPLTLTLPTFTATTTTVTYSFGSTVTSTGTSRTPLEDPRIGWIHTMRKPELMEEMSKHGLSTEGTMEVLRKRFTDYWKRAREYVDARDVNRLTQSLATQPQVTFSSPGLASSLDRYWTGAVGGQPSTTHATTLGDYNEERSSIRDLLRLSPNADSYTTVKQTLAELLGNSRTGDTPRHTHLDSQRENIDSRIPRPHDLFIRPIESGATESVPRNSTIGVSTLCNMVRKWGLRFDGKKGPVSFLERLEELIEAYSLPPDDVLKAMPELLQGTALLWYRNEKDELTSFSRFRSQFERQFLPIDYQRNLDEEIRKRTQGEQESFRDFVTAISTLIRRSGNFSVQEKLDLVYENTRPEYKIMVRRSDFATLSQLTEKAEEYEAFLKARDSFRAPPPPSQALVPETAYTRSRNAEKNIASTTVDLSPAREENSRKCIGSPRKPSNQTYDNSGEERNRKGGLQRRNAPSSKIGPRKTVCWNCEKDGHLFRDCPDPKVLRCFRCKREGVATTKCDCNPGNGNRTRRNGGLLGPTRSGSAQPPKSGSSGSKQ